MSYYNLGDSKKALSLLNKAEEQVEAITPEIWKLNYSSNNPAEYPKDIQKFKDIISLNKEIVEKNGDVVVDSALVSSIVKGLPFESLSSEGLSSGYAVSACCAANSGNVCNSPRNVCRQAVQGTFSCAGVCSATVAPGDPSWSGPNPATVCTGTTVTQTRCAGETRQVAGTKSCPGPVVTVSSNLGTPSIPVTTCSPRTWAPAASTICSGVYSTQYNGCSTRQVYGTKNCSTTTACVPTAWAPAASTICSTQQLQQNNGCGANRQVWGTKYCPETIDGQCRAYDDIDNASGKGPCIEGIVWNPIWNAVENTEGEIIEWTLEWSCRGSSGGVTDSTCSGQW